MSRKAHAVLRQEQTGAEPGQARQVAPHHRLVNLLLGLLSHHSHSLFGRAPRTRDDEAGAEPRQARQVAGQRERQHSLIDALGPPHRPPHRPRNGWCLCAEQRPRLLASLPLPPPTPPNLHMSELAKPVERRAKPDFSVSADDWQSQRNPRAWSAAPASSHASLMTGICYGAAGSSWPPTLPAVHGANTVQVHMNPSCGMARMPAAHHQQDACTG